MLKIGDFSKLSRVSIRMLRHYDEIGLLHPVKIDPESGYRYYNENQLPIAGRITALKDMLLAKGAKDVRICTMLLKPDVYDKPDKIDYVGKEIPNAFILGFGLDYDELGRNSKDIYVIDE